MNLPYASTVMLLLPTLLLPARPGVTRNHRAAHALAEAAGRWRCGQCQIALVDTCALQLTTDDGGPVYVAPVGADYARIDAATKDLACGSCIGKKRAQLWHDTRAARNAGPR